MLVPSGPINEIDKSRSKVCAMFSDTVTLATADVIPETIIVEFVTPKSGMAALVLLLKARLAPGDPLGTESGIVIAPFVAVLNRKSNWMFPQPNAGEVVN